MAEYISKAVRAVCECCGAELPKNASGRLCAICRRERSPLKDYSPPGWSLSGKPLALVDMEAKAFDLSYGQYTAAVMSGSIINLLRVKGLSGKQMEDTLKNAFKKFKKAKRLYSKKKNYAGF